MTQVYDENNIFRKIIDKVVPCDFLYEDEHVVAINDANPVAPIHILVLSKGNYCDLGDFVKRCNAEEQAGFMAGVAAVVDKFQLDDKGYRVVTNIGQFGMQSVMHMHWHLISGQKLGAMVNLDQDKWSG